MSESNETIRSRDNNDEIESLYISERDAYLDERFVKDFSEEYIEKHCSEDEVPIPWSELDRLIKIIKEMSESKYTVEGFLDDVSELQKDVKLFSDDTEIKINTFNDRHSEFENKFSDIICILGKMSLDKSRTLDKDSRLF